MSTAAQKGTVYLVGAGPGDPDLLTVRALRLLESADLVLHDDLVPEAVVALAGRHTLVTSVGKRCGRPRVTQARIGTMMVEAARGGQAVVRLKGGDPLVFGRAGEELAVLRRAGVPFEVVPGVTAALAAGAALRLPLTDRAYASRLVFATAHHAADGDAKPLWPGALPPDTTLVVYMPGRDMSTLMRELAGTGLMPHTACCAVSCIGSARQSTAVCRLRDLGQMKTGPAPLLVLVGPAVEPLLAGDEHALAGSGEAVLARAGAAPELG